MIDCAGPSEVVYYYHFDSLGSVIALSDVNSVIVERYSYTAFGEPNRVSAVGNPYMFTARRYDTESGLYYYRARMYNAQIGRFLQPDPIGYGDGMNIYAYVANNPLNWIDPLGEFRFGKRPLADVLQDFERPVGKFSARKHRKVSLSYNHACKYSETNLHGNSLNIDYIMQPKDLAFKRSRLPGEQEEFFDNRHGYLNLTSWGIDKVVMQAH